MARLGITSSTTKHAQETTNKAGGVAYAISDPSARMLHIVGQMFNEPTYYADDPKDAPASGLTSEAQAVIDTATAIADGPTPHDLLSIAWFARDELRMRTTPTVLYAVAAERLPKHGLGTRLRLYADQIMQRADEPRNALAAWLAIKGVKGGQKKSVPNALRRAIRDRLVSLPEHLLAKYDSPGRPSLADTIRLCARDAIGQAKLLYFVNPEKWAARAEETPVLAAKAALHRLTAFDTEAQALARKAHATWEGLVSHFGSKPAVWSFCIGQMGYMALLRNLRNLCESGVDMAPALAKIRDRDEVLRSRQLPFRFLSAAEALADLGMPGQAATNALADAMDHACLTLPRLPGTTAVFVDNSGSMANATVSAKSKMTVRGAANILGAIASKVSEQAACFVFSTDVRFVPIQARDSVLSIAKALSLVTDPRATNAHLCPGALQKLGVKADRILLLSDMQCWDSYDPHYGGGGEAFRAAVQHYRGWRGGKVWVHSVNLAGTVQAQMSDGDAHTNLISGFSERVFDVIAKAEGVGTDVATTSRTPTLDYVRSKYQLP